MDVRDCVVIGAASLIQHHATLVALYCSPCGSAKWISAVPSVLDIEAKEIENIVGSQQITVFAVGMSDDTESLASVTLSFRFCAMMRFGNVMEDDATHTTSRSWQP